MGKSLKTEQYMAFVKAWQTSDSRQEAHQKYNKNTGYDTPYNLFMQKIRYMKDHKGINLKELPRTAVNWDAIDRFAQECL